MEATLLKEFRGKTILVTGGCGSIGRDIIKHLLKYSPKTIRILDNNETGLFELGNDLEKHGTGVIRLLVGDVRDKDRIDHAMEGVDIVFHAAALKHVPLCEQNPFEAIKTNVIGTQNILESAWAQGVAKLLFISTDKAVNPNNVMGATKLLGERLTSSVSKYFGSKKTICSSVRFGNVLVSRGSVVPLFINQIKTGGPVTITDKEMTRFIMPVSKSIELILKAVTLMKGSEIFILPMQAVKITDLAEMLIEECAPRFSKKRDELKIIYTGKRPGERLHESLLTDYELKRARVENGLIVVDAESEKSINQNFDSSAIPILSSQNVLKKEDVRQIIRQLLVENQQPI